MVEQTGRLVSSGRVVEVQVHECPRCGGAGVMRRSPGGGRPPLRGPVLWQFCRNCKGRGWVTNGSMPRHPSGVVSHAERKVLRSMRSQRWFYRWRAGESLHDIGQSESPPVSRERVRQLIYEFRPRWEIALVHELHAARGRLREFERTYVGSYRADCWVCGTTFDANGLTSIDFPACERHGTGASARFNGQAWKDLCNMDGRRDARRACPSQGEVTTQPGDPGVNTGMRWTIPGSRMHNEVREAVRCNWPVVILIPVDIVNQHRRELARERMPDGVRGALALSRLHLR